MQHPGQIVGRCQARNLPDDQVALQALRVRALGIGPLQHAGTSAGGGENAAAADNLVAVVIPEMGDAGGPAVTLETPDWLLWIEGLGMSAAVLEFIFEPCSRLNGARAGGIEFGRGPPIARSAIQLRGGGLYAENRHPGCT